MTATKPFTQSPKTYFGILLKTRFQKRGWFFILLFALALLHLYWYFNSDTYGNLVWAFICVVILLGIVVYLYQFAHAQSNQEFLSEKQLFFDSEKMKIVDAKGNEGIIPYDNILFTKETSHYWLLYIDRTQFFYIPKSIFNTPEDFQLFQNYLNS